MNYSDLNLTNEVEYKEINFNNSIIKILTYIPIQLKLHIISDAINNSIINTQKIYNLATFEMFLRMGIVANCTDIKFTEDELANTVDVYDAMEMAGLIDAVVAALPDGAYEKMLDDGYKNMKSAYEYQYSAYGVLDSMQSDYSDLNLDVQELIKGLQNQDEDLALLKDINERLS